MIALSSLAERSPLNFISGRQVFFVYRLYFDGSGKADDPHARYMTLACCAAEEDDWRVFEEEWREALRDEGIPYMHMKDAMACPPRKLFKGWSEDRIGHLIDRLLKVLRKSPQSPLRLFLISVELEAHRKWRSVFGLRKPERMCAEYCFYRPIELYWETEQPVIAGVDAYFDRNEPFLPQIKADWQKKAYKNRLPALQQVRSIEPVEMSLTPGVQVADMMAWSRNRILSNPASDWSDFRYRVAQGVLHSLNCKRVLVDESQVLEKFGRIQ